jgi:GT2 family glycosyltransferase
MAVSLSISLVTYHPEPVLLQQTIASLFVAATQAKEVGALAEAYLTVVDNSENVSAEEREAFLDLLISTWGEQYVVLLTPGNIGYGAGHNCAIHSRCEAFHLIINPDVHVDANALVACVQYLQENPQVGLVTPLCHRPDGQVEYLCKSYPSVGVLLLRGFAPGSIKRYFAKQLAAYDMRHLSMVQRDDILIASGCFMFFRQAALQSVQGFCEAFFLYFEERF